MTFLSLDALLPNSFDKILESPIIKVRGKAAYINFFNCVIALESKNKENK